MRPSKSERLRILCTGASGAFGAHFAAHCLEHGHEVFSIEHDRHPYDTASLLGIKDKITWAQGDIRDGALVSRCVADWEVHAIAHFAALPLVRTGEVVLGPIWSVNVGGTVAMLEAAKQAVSAGRRMHFLFCSTDKVYGNCGDVPYTEDMPLLGNRHYEASKVAAEYACRAAQAVGHVPNLVISRSCNIVAPGDLNWRLLANTTRQFLSGAPAKVYTRGQFVREFIDVRDSVAALYQLLLRADEYAGQAFNVGSGEQWTQEQAIHHIRDTHFPDGHILRVDPPGTADIEIPYQRLDCTKIRRALGWTPRYTLEASVAELVGWWRKHEQLAAWSML